MTSIPALYAIYQTHPFICTDSRKVKKGDLFFALSGENFDGNIFAAAALDKGAAYVIIDDSEVIMGNNNNNNRYLLVKDVLSTLQALAKEHRSHFNIPIIGLTGTNGKTTTKELIAAVLAQKYNIHATKDNFNNQIGVPLTLLSMPLTTEIGIIEMGANHPKEIEFLCKIAAPTHGLVTNVGKAHLEGFGSFEGVCKTKSELYQWLAINKGVAFINIDEPFLENLSTMVEHRIFYTQYYANNKSTTSALASLSSVSPFVHISLVGEEKSMPIHSQLIGAYNFNNILTAIAVAKYFDITPTMVKTAIEGYIPQNNRSQFLKKGSVDFIMDAYNANPVSMEKALLSFSSMSTEGKQKIAILGDMLELGEASTVEHEKIVSLSKALAIDKVIFVGSEFAKIVNTKQTLHFKNVIEVKKWFVAQAFKDSLILLKGSRGIRLEEIVEKI